MRYIEIFFGEDRASIDKFFVGLMRQSSTVAIEIFLVDGRLSIENFPGTMHHKRYTVTIKRISW